MEDFPMSAEENKAIARRHFEELWQKGDVSVADEIYAADAVGHDPMNPSHSDYPESEKQAIIRDNTAFPNPQVIIEDQIAEGDKVVTRWTFRATHSGDFMGMPPSGKRLDVTGVHIHRIAGGKIAEIWAYPDALSFMQQLGAIPPLGQGAS
jgi:steroid delta-isomerase-like uncharacterized protein